MTGNSGFARGLADQLTFKENVNGTSVFNLESLVTSLTLHMGPLVLLAWLIARNGKTPGMHLLTSRSIFKK